MTDTDHPAPLLDGQAAATLTPKDALFKALVEQSLAGIYIIQNGKIRYCNPMFANLFGYASAQDLIDIVAVSDLVAPQDREMVAENIRKRMAEKLDLRYSFRASRKDGSHFDVEVHGRSIDYEGHPAVIGVILDITERKLAEQKILQLNEALESRVQERTAALVLANDELRDAAKRLTQTEKMAAVGRLATAMAHKINTPLGNIIVAASSLRTAVHDLETSRRKAALTPTAIEDFIAHSNEGLGLVERNGQRVAALINQLKQASIDQDGGFREPFYLRALVQNFLDSNPALRDKQGCEINLDIADDIHLDSYPDALRQVLTSLVANSIRHGFAGRRDGVICISAELRGESVALNYADNGAGMSSATVKHAFDPFYAARLGQGDGGLGLYSAYGLITNKMGGSIDLSSELGDGVRITMLLPVVWRA